MMQRQIFFIIKILATAIVIWYQFIMLLDKNFINILSNTLTHVFVCVCVWKGALVPVRIHF